MHPNTNPSNADFLQVLRKAGFPPLTALQEKLAPLLLKGRDLVAESAPGTDTAVGLVLPLILGLRGAGLAPHALFLLPSGADVGKVSQAVGRFMRAVKDVPAFVPLGEIEDARREQRRLEKGATIVAGTTERVIDHLRRGGLEIRELATVIVQEPGGEARADFIKDVQFIFGRLAGRHQTVLLSSRPPGDENELMALLRHPFVVSAPSSAAARSAAAPSVAGSAPSPSPERENLLFQTAGMDPIEALARVLLGRKIPSALVLCPPRLDPRRIAQALRLHAVRAFPWPSGPAAPGQRARPPRSGGDRSGIPAEAEVLIASVPPVLGEGFHPSYVVYLDFPAGGNRSARWTSNVIALLDRGQEKEISRLQEAIGVTLKREELPTDDEVVTGSIDRFLRNLRIDKDRAELLRLRSRIRRQVPLLQRPLFMAYLLRSLLPPRLAPQSAPPVREPAARPDGAGRREAPPPQPRGRFGRSVEVPRPVKPQAIPGLPGQEFTQLFVSIGRNRRVFARELTELFTEKLQLGANELGSVRVFDKYSFVDIKTARADEAIAKLSGSEVKGRTITVNYAKKKEEKER